MTCGSVASIYGVYSAFTVSGVVETQLTAAPLSATYIPGAICGMISCDALSAKTQSYTLLATIAYTPQSTTSNFCFQMTWPARPIQD